MKHKVGLSRVILIQFLFSFILVYPLYDLNAQIKPAVWEIGLSSLGGTGDQAPFWFVSNRQGKYLPEKFASAIEAGFFAEPDTGKVFDYGYGIELFGRTGGVDYLWLHQAFGEIRLYDLVQLRFGMWEDIVGSYEPSISSGSIIWSGNARPLPRIEISVPEYNPVPYTNGFAEIKGLISHGWFEEGRYASDVWLHHKNVYLRLGGDYPLNFHYGFNHYAQWGGSSPRQEESYPSDFRAYLRVFFNLSGDPDEEGTPEGWVINKKGNSVGSRNVGFDLNMGTFSAGIYLQDVFEDGSGMRRVNFPDGLWGARFRFNEEKKPVQAVVYEFLHTTDQSGPEHSLDAGLVGNDNYFNHGHYRSGWTYHSYTIGTPLITSPFLVDDDVYGIINNRVIAHHFGIEGYIEVWKGLAWRQLFTYSRNYGTHSRPFDQRRDQFSWLMELVTPLDLLNLDISVSLAADVGDMYGDNYGLMIKLSKDGVLGGE